MFGKLTPSVREGFFSNDELGHRIYRVVCNQMEVHRSQCAAESESSG